MSVHEILIIIMAAFAGLGAIDRIFGNRFGLGKEFENGIIYDVSEYPKFTGARAERFGNYLIYTILDPRESQSAFEAVKKTENK